MKRLPIGIQTFRTIREEGYCYVDKTPLIARLVDEGKYYFLSRPRRFGKSLLVDTLAEAFAGSRELFAGLHLADHWDWSRRFAVLRIDLAEGLLQNRERLDERLNRILAIQAARYGISLTTIRPDDRLEELILALHEASGAKVVVLVDEYDKPILDSLTDVERARELRDGLKNIYSVLKAQGAHLQFVLLTGVSKFSKVSLFSGLNNLEDITLDPRYATLCGYTQEQLETVFADYLAGVDLDEVRRWYNGYNFLGERVYNPFDALLYLRNRELRSYWFETGTPSLLIQRIMQRGMPAPDLERLTATERLLGSFDVDAVEPEALLFQTGYLTIHERLPMPGGGFFYRLGFPNREVRQALSDALLSSLVQGEGRPEQHKLALYQALEANAVDRLRGLFHAFFASIPYPWYVNNPMAGFEGYYASIVYCYFAALGLDVTPEESSNQGRTDLTVRYRERVYVIEFKVNELAGPGKALEQIKARDYHAKHAGREVYLIGIEFSREQRNVTAFEWELA